MLKAALSVRILVLEDDAMVGDGYEIAESLVALQPGLRVVLRSGYGVPRYGADPSPPMLSKPLEADELVERVERALAN